MEKSKLLSTNFESPSVKNTDVVTNNRRIPPLIIKTGQLSLFRKGMFFVNESLLLILNQLTFFKIAIHETNYYACSCKFPPHLNLRFLYILIGVVQINISCFFVFL